MEQDRLRSQWRWLVWPVFIGLVFVCALVLRFVLWETLSIDLHERGNALIGKHESEIIPALGAPAELISSEADLRRSELVPEFTPSPLPFEGKVYLYRHSNSLLYVNVDRSGRVSGVHLSRS